MDAPREVRSPPRRGTWRRCRGSPSRDGGHRGTRPLLGVLASIWNTRSCGTRSPEHSCLRCPAHTSMEVPASLCGAVTLQGTTLRPAVWTGNAEPGRLRLCAVDSIGPPGGIRPVAVLPQGQDLAPQTLDICSAFSAFTHAPSNTASRRPVTDLGLWASAPLLVGEDPPGVPGLRPHVPVRETRRKC